MGDTSNINHTLNVLGPLLGGSWDLVRKVSIRTLIGAATNYEL